MLALAPFDEEGNYLGDDWTDPTYEAEVAALRARVLAEAPGGLQGAHAAIAWAVEARLEPDTAETIATVLSANETFAEDQFFQLLDRIGLSLGSSRRPHAT